MSRDSSLETWTSRDQSSTGGFNREQKANIMATGGLRRGTRFAFPGFPLPSCGQRHHRAQGQHLAANGEALKPTPRISTLSASSDLTDAIGYWQKLKVFNTKACFETWMSQSNSRP